MKIFYYTLLFSFLTFSAFTQGLIEYQKFTIDTERDTTLTGKYGTEILIPAQSFDFNSSSLQISLKEIFSMDEFILEQVSTESPEGVLASDGMVLVEALVKEEKVTLAEGKKIEIRIPTFESSSGMRVYSLSDDTLKLWEKSDIPLQLDTCEERRFRIVWDKRKVSKEEYREWKKKSSAEKDGPPTRLFGGKTIVLRVPSTRRKEYFIPIAKDTICECEGPSLAKYIFAIQNLGWYNIDKLLEESADLYALRLYTSVDLNYFLVLEDDVCIRGRKRDGYYLFRTPRNKIAKLIGYRKISRDEMLLTVVERLPITRKVIRLDKAPQKIGKGAMHNWLRGIR